MHSRKSSFKIILIIALAISGILYLLADRYLIEHVEIENTSQFAATAAASLTAGEMASAGEMAESPVPQATGTASATPEITFSDEWNYQSNSFSITIEEVVNGSGKNTVTYFVADVILSDATLLRNAFAKDEFGQNIIEYTSEIAAENDAIFAVNGDYYGFRSDGIIIRNGILYRDQPARIGLAFFTDGSMKIYDETQTSAQALLDEGVWNTLSFGPAILQDSTIPENLADVSIDKNIGNHSIQGNNPRTGVGVIDNNHFVFVVVDGRSKGYSKGLSLAEFAEVFKSLGCSEAYNLDGGGSSTMYFMGRVVNNPLGKNKERGTSDILYIGQ